MDVAALLIESHNRVGGVLHRAVGGLAPGQLTWRADPEANTIAWLAWHAARGEDAQVADVAGTEQVWTAQGWAEPVRAAVRRRRHRVRSGQRRGRPGAGDRGRAARLLRRGGGSDEGVPWVGWGWPISIGWSTSGWDPPVTLGVRLVSVVSDSLQHAGQASFLRGLLERAT